MMLHDRSDASLELQHQNIGVALKGLGEEWTPAKKPALQPSVASTCLATSSPDSRAPAQVCFREPARCSPAK